MDKTQRVFRYEDLSSADLVVDAVYEAGRRGNLGDDPLHALLRVSVMGGFRYRGRLSSPDFVVLTTSMSDAEWPDLFDREAGVLTYYGDNKKPGRKLLETPRHGNEILDALFQLAAGDAEQRRRMPPVFVFASAESWRDMVFLGLAVPGTLDARPSEDLVAVWKGSGGRRFQNYRARFSILNEEAVSRSWINDLIDGRKDSPHVPATWRRWCDTGERVVLRAPSTREHRLQSEQLPNDVVGRRIVAAIHDWFSESPHEFERCAAKLAELVLHNVTTLDVTRVTRDGGRDAVGRFRIGTGQASIFVEFALEAKCYGVRKSVGVRDVSRLISRLRHREFGVLVTTSYLHPQAYKEIRADGHPIIVLAAVDIVAVLREVGKASLNLVQEWLRSEYPKEDSGQKPKRVTSGRRDRSITGR